MKFLLLLTFIFLMGCATSERKSASQLASLLKTGDLETSIKFVQGAEFYPEERSKLLKLVEKGTLLNLNHQYYQSLKTFEEAQDLSDKLFTVSISKKVTSSVLNENLDNYYGEKFERSMIRYYLVLNHYLLYQLGKYEAPEKILDQKERRFHLSAARSVLLEWNSLLESYRAVSGSVATYKDDLLAKVFGGFIHEQIGSVEDRNIALNLYKTSKTILFRNFNLYATYNENYKDFEKNFSEFAKMKEADVKSKYVKETELAKNLVKFLDERIEHLSKNTKENAYFLIEDNLITPKTANKFDIPLPVFSGAAAHETMGFAIRVLSTPVAGTPKIYFELPQIEFSPVTDKMELLIKNAAGELIQTINLAVVNPLSELAHFTLADKSTSQMTTTGVRVAAKHAAALIAAYQIYKAQSKSNDFFAMTLASVSYSLANKGIEASEACDLRHWSTLPNSFRLGSTNLPLGIYSAVLVKTKGTNREEKNVGNIEIKADLPISFIKIRSF